MDDSRDYFDIAISGRKVQLFTKYLGAELYATELEGNLYLLVHGLSDSDSIRIPDFVCELPEHILMRDSACYNEDEEMWEPIYE